MPTPPALTNEQRRQAYEKALQLRRLRKALKQELGAGGELTFGQVWIHQAAQGMKVLDLLAALPRMGKPSALKLMEQAGFKHPEKTTVRATGPRQREKLFELLTAKSPR